MWGDGDRSSGTIFLAVAAGASVTDAVEVINFTGESASFDVYVADVVATTEGGRAPAAREVAISGPAAWIDVPQPSVEVPGRSGNLVSFTVDPPPNTSPGAYTVAILVQPQETATGGAIAATTRAGLWIEIEVLEGSDAAPVVPFGPAISWDVPWIPLIAVALIAFAAAALSQPPAMACVARTVARGARADPRLPQPAPTRRSHRHARAPRLIPRQRKTTVRWPWSRTRRSTCQRTARARATHSTSRPTRESSATLCE